MKHYGTLMEYEWNTDEFDGGRELQDNKQKEQIIFEYLEHSQKLKNI